MPTFDLVVAPAPNVRPWRASRERKALALASAAALALGAAAWLARPAAVSVASAPAKLEARIPVAADRAPTADETRLAAFQQAVALSFVKPLASDAASPPDAAKATHPHNRAVATAAKRDVAAAAPLPPPRPPEPRVILADLPPPPPAAEPGYVDASLAAMANVGQGVADAPNRARELGVAAMDRLGGALSAIRAGVGL